MLTIRIALMVLTLFLFADHPSAQRISEERSSNRKVLVIHSYHQGLGWTDRIQKGIQDTFDDSKFNVEMHVEYLDTKRHAYEEVKGSLHSILEYKHQGEKYDVVIASDDNAIDFAIKHRGFNHVPLDTPIIFCGANKEGPNAFKETNNIAGVIEHYDIEKTIDLILKLQPNITDVVIISDQSSDAVSGIKKVLKKSDLKVNLKWIDGWTKETLQDSFKSLPDTTAIIKASMGIDRRGDRYTLGESINILSSITPFKIYSMCDFEIGNQIVGGYVIDGYRQGRLAALLSIRIFNGEVASAIPLVESSPNSPMVNYLASQDLNLDGLSSDTIMINYPISFYDKNKEFIWIGIVLLIIQMFVIIALIVQRAARRKVEKVLRFNTFVVEHIKDSTYWIDNTGTFTWVNEAAANYLGYEKNEIVGMKVWDIHFDDFGPDEFHTIFARLRVVKYDLIVHTHKAKDGSKIPVEISANYVTFGDREYVCAFSRDISERLKHESLIKENELKYRLLVETSPYGIEELDLNGKVTYVNTAFAKMMKMDVDDIIGHYIWEFVAVGEREPLKNHIIELGKTEKRPVTHYGKNVTKGGRTFDVQVDWDYKRVDGKIVGFIGLVTDISDIVRYKRRQELSSAILDILNSSEDAETTIRHILAMIKSFTSFDAVAIRLQEDEDYPYYVTSGFTDDFVSAESSICSRERVGPLDQEDENSPCLDCMCGIVICGQTDPNLPYFTSGGSFWTNSTTRLLEDNGTPEGLKIKTRNRCNAEGYESVGLIPLVAPDGGNIGLLQLNDRRKDMIDLEIIQFFEGLGSSIGIALGRKQAANQLRESEEKYRGLYDTAPVAFIFWDGNGFIREWNEHAEDIFGWTKEEAIGESFFDFLIPESEMIKVKDVVDHIMQQDVPDLVINDNLTKDGRTITCEWRSMIVYDDKKQIAGVISTGQNITSRVQAEKELRTSAQIFESVPSGILIYDCGGVGVEGEDDGERIVLVDGNPAAEELTGASLNKMRGKCFNDLWPNAKDLTQILVKECIENECTYSNEAYHYKDDNMDGVFRIEAFCIPNNRIAIAFENVTAEYKSSQALKDSEEKFRSSFETIPDAITIIDLDTNFVDVNEGFTKLSGYKKEDVIGKSILEFGIWNDSQDRDLFFEELSSNGFVDSFQTKLKIKDGRIGDALVSSNFIDIKGKKHIISITKDITEAVEAQQAIRDSENVFRTAFETIPDAVAINRKSDGRYLHVNDGYLQLSGYTWEELKGKSSVEAGLWADRKFRDKIVKRIKREGKISNFEVNFKKKSGEIRNGLMSAASIKLDNEWCTLTITKDITERKKREDELLEKERQIRRASKMEAVGTLAGGVAHDFNNIIQIISGNVQLLMVDEESETLLQKYKVMHDATMRGADLSRRLLMFSRNVESKLKPTDVNNEIRLAHKLLDRSIAGPVLINIDLELDNNLNWAIADPTQLYQVITNLCLNAKDAMPKGGHVVISTKNIELDDLYCSTHHDVIPGKYVRITIADDGEGMPKEIQERIFEPFFTTKEPGKGTGLGLAVVYGIIKNHHGHITVYSSPGKGTEFKLFIPISEVELEEKEETKVEELIGGNETILIVDDEDNIRAIGYELLTKYGYTVFTAYDGKTALEEYTKNQDKIDLVILDLVMPQMSGTDVLIKFRKMDPDVKVIVASGYSANGPVRDALNKGAKRFIDKPYTLHQLLTNVREVLDEGD